MVSQEVPPDPSICFDAFGTLVEITDKRRPFRALLRGGVKSITAGDVLTKLLNLQEVAASVSHRLGEGGLTELERDLQAECASIRLSSDSVASQRMAMSFAIEFHGGLVNGGIEAFRPCEGLMSEMMLL